MKEQQTAGQEGIFTRKLLRNLTFPPCMNASLKRTSAKPDFVGVGLGSFRKLDTTMAEGLSES